MQRALVPHVGVELAVRVGAQQALGRDEERRRAVRGQVAVLVVRQTTERDAAGRLQDGRVRGRRHAVRAAGDALEGVACEVVDVELHEPGVVVTELRGPRAEQQRRAARIHASGLLGVQGPVQRVAEARVEGRDEGRRRSVADVEVEPGVGGAGRELPVRREVDAGAAVVDADHALDAGAVGIARGEIDEGPAVDVIAVEVGNPGLGLGVVGQLLAAGEVDEVAVRRRVLVGLVLRAVGIGVGALRLGDVVGRGAVQAHVDLRRTSAEAARPEDPRAVVGDRVEARGEVGATYEPARWGRGAVRQHGDQLDVAVARTGVRVGHERRRRGALGDGHRRVGGEVVAHDREVLGSAGVGRGGRGLRAQRRRRLAEAEGVGGSIRVAPVRVRGARRAAVEGRVAGGVAEDRRVEIVGELIEERGAQAGRGDQ